jgi:hypothetical protein
MVVNLARADAVCGSFGEVVFAAPNERNHVVLPTGYGYFNPWYSYWIAGPPILQNYSKQPVSVYLDFTATFVPGTENIKHTTFIGIDQVDCGTSPPFYAIPAGYSDAHKEWIANRAGEIVTVVGHMHDYGISVALENVTTGQPICISRGGYAEGSPWAPVGPGSGIDEYHPVSHNVLTPGDPDYAGHIERTDICFPGLRVERGDILRLHTQYNSPMPMADAMGTMGVVMHVTDAPPCTLAIRPIYQDNTLWLLFNLGKSQAEQGHEVTWNLWSVTNAGVTPLMSELIPVIDPQRPTVRAIPNLPPAGMVGFLLEWSDF